MESISTAIPVDIRGHEPASHSDCQATASVDQLSEVGDVMDDRRQPVDSQQRKPGGRGSILARVVTVVLAVAVCAGALFLFAHWGEIQRTGEACMDGGKCVTLAPGHEQGTETVGSGE